MNQQEMKTTDLALAATLVSLGYETRIGNMDDSGRATFSFAYSQNLETTVQQFWNRRLVVEPTNYFASIKQLKSMIYSHK